MDALKKPLNIRLCFFPFFSEKKLLCLSNCIESFETSSLKGKNESDAKQGSWILGGGWNNDLWGGELPMASWIDEITPYNPVSHSKRILVALVVFSMVF